MLSFMGLSLGVMNSAICVEGCTQKRDAARRHAYAAIEAGGDDAMALAMGGFVVGVIDRNYEIALEALDRSMALI